MPAFIHYKGELYFSNRSELEAALHVITNKILDGEQQVWETPDSLKLTIDVEAPFGKKEVLEEEWKQVLAFASSGMILVFEDQQFRDVLLSSRLTEFSPEKPAILVFMLHEFERTHGKLSQEISETVYNSPFFIYDISLKKKMGLKFEDEKDISDADCNTGFEILRKIWTEDVAEADTPLFDILFKKQVDDDDDPDEYSVESNYGFVPGYDLNEVIETARKYKFLVFRWDEYWRD